MELRKAQPLAVLLAALQVPELWEQHYLPPGLLRDLQVPVLSAHLQQERLAPV